MLTKLTPVSALENQDVWVDLSQVMKVDRKNVPKQSLIIQTDDIEFTKLTFLNNQTAVCADHPDVLIPMINEALSRK